MTPEEFGRAVVAHLQGWLRAFQEEEAALDRQRDALVAQGFRIVGGGQKSAWSEGKALVEYTDDTTGEVLFSGEVSDPDESLGDDNWCHVDRLHDDVPLPEHAVDPSLPTAVRRVLESMSEACLELGTDNLRELLGEVTSSTND